MKKLSALTSYKMFLYNFDVSFGESQYILYLCIYDTEKHKKQLTRIYVDRLRRSITSKYTDRSIFSVYKLEKRLTMYSWIVISRQRISFEESKVSWIIDQISFLFDASSLLLKLIDQTKKFHQMHEEIFLKRHT